MTLTSTRSPRVQAVRRLTRRSARVPSAGSSWRARRRYARRSRRLLELYADPTARQRFGELLAQAPCPVTPVTREVLAAMAETVTPQGVLGVAPLLDVPLATALQGTPRLVAVLEAVSDPGNAGTVIRTADAAGADAVVLTDGLDRPARRQVRAGDRRQPVAPARRARPDGRRGGAGAAGRRPAGARHQRQRRGRRPRRPRSTPERCGPTAWLLGTEAAGLSEQALALADRTVRIPIHGRAESLNLSTAAAVCLYASARASRTRPGLNRDRGVAERPRT
jgi:TrmH family RNA methyltransferase